MKHAFHLVYASVTEYKNGYILKYYHLVQSSIIIYILDTLRTLLGSDD